MFVLRLENNYLFLNQFSKINELIKRNQNTRSLVGIQ